MIVGIAIDFAIDFGTGVDIGSVGVGGVGIGGDDSSGSGSAGAGTVGDSSHGLLGVLGVLGAVLEPENCCRRRSR